MNKSSKAMIYSATVFLTVFQIQSLASQERDKGKCSKTDKELVHADQFSKTETSESLQKYQKLSAKQKICVNGKVYTKQEIENARARNRADDEQIEKAGRLEASKRFEKNKNSLNKQLTLSNTAKKQKYSKIAEYFKKNKRLPADVEPAKTEPAASTLPQISGISDSKFSPGDSIILGGERFGSTKGTIQLKLTDGRAVPATIDLWSDTGVSFRVGQLGGIPAPLPGSIVVTTSASKSSPAAQFTFEPEMETRRLCVWQDDIRSGACDDLRGPGGGGDGRVEDDHFFTCTNWLSKNMGSALHNGGLWFGCSGSDTLLEDVSLKNGWVVSDMEFIVPWAAGENATAGLTSFSKNTPSLKFTASYSVEAVGMIVYKVDIYIRGPKGVPYK
ncbi:MAG: hypothetical protein K8S54_05480 [Spirochaetia bacterium]|nr:hypothetical protein [Spirochaetia bacterium]